jgi:hypothetical protein
MVGSFIVVGRLSSLLACALVALAGAARADDTPAPGPEELLNVKIAVWRFDALGIEPELVARLETLFRMELDRLDRQPLPNRRDIERALTAELRDCSGEDKCLAQIGKRLNVDVVITGTVGAMGDNYVLNIKAVDANSARQIQRITSEPLRGSPDELIDGVRVAAYKLLAPNQLYGAVQVQTDLVGASVALDDRPAGKTPLPNLGVLNRLALGKHRLRVEAPGYAPFDEDVDVRFQKVSQVVVRLLPSTVVIGTGKVIREERRPFYTRTWFIAAAAASAVLVGYAIGHSAGQVDVHCFQGATPVACR